MRATARRDLSVCPDGEKCAVLNRGCVYGCAPIVLCGNPAVVKNEIYSFATHQIPLRLPMKCRDLQDVLWKFGGRRPMDHGVCVLDADAVCSKVMLRQVHDGVVGVLLGPVPLPFEQYRK